MSRRRGAGSPSLGLSEEPFFPASQRVGGETWKLSACVFRRYDADAAVPFEDRVLELLEALEAVLLASLSENLRQRHPLLLRAIFQQQEGDRKSTRLNSSHS